MKGGYDLVRVFIDISEWCYRLMILNFCWIAGILAGLVIFGITPSTIAMHTVTRKWAQKELDFSVPKTFFQAYKENFIGKNIIGFSFLGIGIFLLINLRISFIVPGTLMMITFYFNLFLLLLLIMSVIMFFNIYTKYHYETKWQYMKQSIAFTIASPGTIVLHLIGFVVMGTLLYRLPGLIPFCSGSLIAYWSSIVTNNRFKKLEKRVLGENNSTV